MLPLLFCWDLPVSRCKEILPDNQFRLGILGTDMRHASVALFGIEFIGHGWSINGPVKLRFFSKPGNDSRLKAHETA